jgi:alkanesulfonate monooxygenase SsuD/methylene tetrahydromethanopterin reductase-like flavin-dependent oxidoreductase (luciferase family)
VRYAVNIPPFTDASTVVELAVAADEAGWDAVFVWDHLRWIVAMGLDIHDPWSLLAAMALKTDRVLLGTCVTPLSRRRPQVVAKQLVTLDHLSGGRAVLGIGLGEPPDADFSDFGDEADPVRRGEALDEAVDIVARLVSGERADVDGAHHRVHAEMRPAAVQRPRPPVFVAGTFPNRRPLQRALRWDGFFPIGASSLLTPDQLDGSLDGVDRPPGWDLYAVLTDEHHPDDFAAVGVTWLVQGTWPSAGWVDELARRITAGPPR